ncbi:protein DETOXIFICATION 49 isoform X1 [Tanacetum coccineum]|uniref:Protein DETOXIFICATION 49 isoform X1 n=1 Tax=Tanacetum coccineum TaxID=301880 RepID=A0ABQ5A8Z6_9ASTR
MIFSGLHIFSKSFISTFVLGRVGTAELAGASLSIALVNVTGFSVLSGLAMGMDGIASQAFGARNFLLMARTLHQTILILLAAFIPITIMWLNAEPILVFFGQDLKIATLAATYTYFTIPTLFLQCFFHPIKVYLRAKKVTYPFIIGSVLALVSHVVANGVLFWLDYGLEGVALALVVTDFVYLFTLLVYLYTTSDIAINSFDFIKCFTELRPILSLAIASFLSVCLEWWFYELMLFFSGLLPKDKEAAIGAMNILLQATSFIYIFPSSISMGVSARVGYELGANMPKNAEHASYVALLCAVLTSFMAVALTIATRDVWGGVFTEDSTIISLISAAMLVLGVCELGNCSQTVISGVLRGCARPRFVAWVNFGSFYLIGLPMALFFGFGIQMGFVGLWKGLFVAQVACLLCMCISLWKIDWEKQATEAQERVS